MMWQRWSLVVLLVFQGLSGCLGGLRLVTDPSGASIELPMEWLEGSVFSSYLVPGLVLLLVLGVGPLIAAYGVWRARRWGWISTLAVGLGLLVWLAVQIRIIGYHADPPLQLGYALIGCAIVALTAFGKRPTDARG